MICTHCNGTGKQTERIVIPLWHRCLKDFSVELVEFNGENSSYDYATSHDEIKKSARAFHEMLRAHGHGVFYDELHRLFKEA